MSAMLKSYILLIGVLPWTLGYTCLQYPVRYLENGCVVRNLTVRDVRNNLITDDYTCGANVNRQALNLDWPYNINFSRSIGPEFQYSSFLLVVIDNTFKQLLWMVANITVPPYDKKLTPLSGYPSRPSTIKPYERPVSDASLRDHQIEFLVFQQRTNFPAYPTIASGPGQGQQTYYPFSLHQWLDEQAANGHRFCGPVAGAVVHMHSGNSQYHHQPSYPAYQPNYNPAANAYPNYPASPPHNLHHGRNAAPRFTRDTSLLTACIALLLLLFCYMRQ